MKFIKSLLILFSLITALLSLSSLTYIALSPYPFYFPFLNILLIMSASISLDMFLSFFPIKNKIHLFFVSIKLFFFNLKLKLNQKQINYINKKLIEINNKTLSNLPTTKNNLSQQDVDSLMKEDFHCAICGKKIIVTMSKKDRDLVVYNFCKLNNCKLSESQLKDKLYTCPQCHKAIIDSLNDKTNISLK